MEFACRSTRPATFLGPRKFASSIAAKSGSCRATTRPIPIRPARRSSSCAATRSSPRARSDFPSIAGRPKRRSLPRSARGGRRIATRGARRVLFGYALGKAQRLLAGLADADIGPVYTHGAVERLNRDYRAAGVRLAETRYASDLPRRHDFAGSMIVAPPSAAGSTWLRRFGDVSTGFASGWMRIRGARRRRALDRGFVLSDHVDWPSLLAAVEATGAQRVWVTHGTREPLVRWLTERGIEARRGRRASGRARKTPIPSRSPARRSRREDSSRGSSRAIDETMRTNEKVDAMAEYFASADPARRGVGGLFPQRRPAEAPHSGSPPCRSGRWRKRAFQIGYSRSVMTRSAIWPRRCRCCCRTRGVAGHSAASADRGASASARANRAKDAAARVDRADRGASSAAPSGSSGTS